MSIARFSSDDWKSDVYVYEHADFPDEACWVIHVASNRHVFKVPLPPPVEWNPDDQGQMAKFMNRYVEVTRLVREETDIVPIDGTLDGKDYYGLTAQQCYDQLLAIREAGYYVPEFTFEALREEQGVS